MVSLSDGSVFSLYGRWNALAARGPAGCLVDWIYAHDGDFFPESPLDYVEALREARKRGDDENLVGAWPIRADIDIIQACNCNCLFCYSRKYASCFPYHGAVAAADHVTSLMEELARGGTRTIRFTGGGEPLLHPAIRELLPIPRLLGMRLCVLTNGDLLDENLADLLFHHVDHIRWSVNAASDERRVALHRPRRMGNVLSRTADLMAGIVARRDAERGDERRPCIWATYLLLPSNVDEIEPAARMLRQVGVDSVSFRAVYHGLASQWTATQLQHLRAELRNVASLASPRFLVFVPKRQLSEACTLRPTEHFQYCLSRRLRTVVEATRCGLAVQTCGLWRGSGPLPNLSMNPGEPFYRVWAAARKEWPTDAPGDCVRCIDVSMNVALGFIWAILGAQPAAAFERVWV